MSDLQGYVQGRRKRDGAFDRDYESGYDEFKIGCLLREARSTSGLTQDQLASRLGSSKSAISRIENHAKDIRLSTLSRMARALGKTLRIVIE